MSKYIPTLDGWRALSVIAVILFHGLPADFSIIISQGQLGVSFFFAISGYLITTRLLDDGEVDFQRFYIRRAFRILPPAYIYLAIVALLSLTSFREIASSLFFARNFYGVDWYTRHFWSLAVEEQFYLAWPLILWLGKRQARISALLLVVGIGIWRFLNNRYNWATNPGLVNLPYDGIMWGCWWALMLKDGRGVKAIRQIGVPLAWFGIAIVFVLIVAYKPPASSMLIAAIIPLLILGTVYQPQKLIGRFLEIPVLKWIGRLSYSLYLWQQLFFVLRDFQPQSILQRMPFNWLALLAMAWLSYTLIERPLVRLGHRLTQEKLDKPREVMV